MMIEKWAQAIKNHEGWIPAGQYAKDKRGSPAFRNNNPGNFRCYPLVMGEFGAIGCENNLAIFPDYETGWKALIQFLTYAANGELRDYEPWMNLYDFYGKYAPTSDGNYPNGYAEAVAKEMGISPNTPIGSFLMKSDMYYSQHTPGYKDIKLGGCNDSLWQSACFLASFCNWLKEMGIQDTTPAEMNAYFIKHNLFSNGCLIDMTKIAKHFGLKYEKLTKDPKALCIAETAHYKSSGVPQHFFLYKEGMRVDPLDYPANWEKNDYGLVSFRALSKEGYPKPAPVPEPTPTPTPTPEPTPVPDVPPVDVETPAPVEPVPVEATPVVVLNPFWELVERVIQWFKNWKK